MTGTTHRVGYTAQLTILLSTLVGINIGYMAVLPFLPELSVRLGLDPAGLAVFVSGFAVAKILAQPLGGWLADNAGLRLTGAVGLCLAVVGMVLVGQADSAIPAILGRLAWGAADGIISPALYGAVTVVSAEYGRDPARGYAKLGTAALLSFAAGPFVVGLVHPFADYPVVLGAAAGLTALNAVVAWFVLPGRVAGEPGQDDQTAPPSVLRHILPAVAIFGCIDLFANVLWAAMEPLVPLSLERAQAGSTGRSAWVLGVGMVAFAIANPLLARLSARWRRPKLAGLGFAVLALGCFLLTAVDVLPVGLAAAALFMVAQSYIYLIAREGIREYGGGSGKAWGLFGMFTDAGFIIGPAIGFVLFDSVGVEVFAVLGAGAVAAALAAVIGLRGWRPRAAVPSELFSKQPEGAIE